MLLAASSSSTSLEYPLLYDPTPTPADDDMFLSFAPSDYGSAVATATSLASTMDNMSYASSTRFASSQTPPALSGQRLNVDLSVSRS